VCRAAFPVPAPDHGARVASIGETPTESTGEGGAPTAGGTGAATDPTPLAGLLTSHALGGARDVARTREQRRIVRLERLIGFLLCALALVVAMDVIGHGLFSVHFPRALLPYVPAFLLMVVVLFVLVGPMLGLGRSPHTLYRPGDIDVGLDDVVGIDGIKGEVVRSINLFLAHKSFHDQMGGVPRRGILFEGPPGTGKTFVAKAMARDAGVPFLFVSASAFQSMYYGQTNRKIRAYFRSLHRYARAEGGAIGFIEEFDAIGGARHGLGSGRSDGVSGVVNELLVQMQSFDAPTGARRVTAGIVDRLNRYLAEGNQIRKRPQERANVLVVAATNRADDLDPALLRPGRFDRSIFFGLPGRAARRQILGYYLARKAHTDDLNGVDTVEDLAGMTFGYTPASLERLLDEALVVALSDGRTAMTFADVAEAKMSTELGLTDPTVYTPEERARVAIHEAGHATVAYFVGQGRKLDVLSIVKRRDSLGLLQHSDAEERFTRTRSEIAALLRIAMGGLVAEELFFDGDVSSGPSGDLLSATQLGCHMVGAFGMSGSLVSVAAGSSSPVGGSLVDKVLGDDKSRRALEELLDSARQDAREIVERERAVVEALRDALVERDELIGPEILGVIEAVPGVAGRGKIAPGPDTGVLQPT